MTKWYTYPNLANTLLQRVLALNIIRRQETIIVLALLVIRLAQNRIVGVIIVAVHLVVALFLLTGLVPEVEEPNRSSRLERTQAGKVCL